MRKQVSEKSISKQEFRDPNKLPSVVYKFRIIGMGLASIAIAAVLYENQVSMAYWIWWFVSCFIWPHLAFIVAKKHPDSFKMERRNLLADSFIAGSWASLMWFNLLPAVILLVTTTADKANSGIKGLWLDSQPVIFAGLIFGLIMTGFEFQPETSMLVILASLPIMIVHIAFVSLSSYKLVRRVQSQNKMFKELSQKDSLTQLYNRRHWQQQVDLLIQAEDKQSNLSLLLIDIDRFKHLNDNHGHSIGDEVLLAIAEVISNVTSKDALAGRLGGDEFAIVIQNDLAAAKLVAKEICQQVATLDFGTNNQINCTVSIGLAENKIDNSDFRSWFDDADKNLYQAKDAGRNQIF